MRKAFFLLVLVLALPAAAANVLPPLAVTLSAAPLDTVDSLDFGPLDRGWLAAEDAAREEQDLAPRFAIPHTVHLTPATSGTWEELAGGLWLWRLRIRAEGAASLNLGFTRFRLPEGARLQLYSADLAHVVRPFTAADNKPRGELWTPVVPTDDLVVELTVPGPARADVELEIGQIGQGYRGFGAADLAKASSGSCNMDVACLNGNDPWWQTQRSVALTSLNGTLFCTGSLVNNTSRDHKMYFITARHCEVTSANAASLVAYWNFQNSTCRTPGSAASGSNGDGTLNQFQTGATFRAENSASDFTLVELDDAADPAFHLHWEGWDHQSGDISCPQGSCDQCNGTSLCAGIHQPNIAEKRITFSRQTIQPASWTDGSSPGDGTHLWVHWDPTPVFPPNPSLSIPAQVTEPGSSGSPLYDQANRFIGQLHGGPSACGQTGDNLSDYYGRFSVSWTAAAAYLDPGNTGALFIDSVDDVNAPIFVDGFESGATAAWSATFP
jgi:lysyl endopeptidase